MAARVLHKGRACVLAVPELAAPALAMSPRR
jgi:hypothetical protein